MPSKTITTLARSANAPGAVSRQAASGSTITVKRTRPSKLQLPLEQANPVSKPDAVRRQAPSTVKITVHHHHQKSPRQPAEKPQPTLKPNAARPQQQAASIAKNTVNNTATTTTTRPTARTTGPTHGISQISLDKTRAFAIANSAKQTDADNRLQELRLRLAEQQRQIRIRDEAKEEEMRVRLDELRNRTAIEREWAAGAEQRLRERREVAAANKRREEEEAAREEEEDTEDLEWEAAQDRWYADLRERDLVAFASTEKYRREAEAAFVDFSGVWC